MNILIADDEPDMRKILRLYLEREGFRTSLASDGEEALKILLEKRMDLAVLDWMMPGMDGIAVCREIRRLNIPVKVLMLTAKGESRDEVRGLTCGADDYLRKPFDIQVLLLRIRKLCRGERILSCGEIEMNQDTGRVLRGGQEVALTRTEYELLRLFLLNQRVVLSRERILDGIWGQDFEGDARTVDTYIKRLRGKLGSGVISTRIGLGYVMERQP